MLDLGICEHDLVVLIACSVVTFEHFHGVFCQAGKYTSFIFFFLLRWYQYV